MAIETEIMPRRTILIAVDDPKASLCAVKWAVEQMYQDGDEIVLFHVVPWSTPWVYADKKIELEEREKKAMAQLVLDYTSLVDAKFNTKLEEGKVRFKFEVVASRSNDFDDSPAQLIVNKAASVNSCVIIVARSNKSKLVEFFVGSVTSEVIKRSKVPVLIFNE